MRGSAGQPVEFPLDGLRLGLRSAAAAFIGGRMRYAMTIIAVLLCVTAHGCATDKHLTPPDSVLDPRGQ